MLFWPDSVPRAVVLLKESGPQPDRLLRREYLQRMGIDGPGGLHRAPREALRTPKLEQMKNQGVRLSTTKIIIRR